MSKISWKSKAIYAGFSVFIVATTLKGWRWDEDLLGKILIVWAIICPIAGALFDMVGVKSFGKFCLVAFYWFSLWCFCMIFVSAVLILSQAGFSK